MQCEKWGYDGPYLCHQYEEEDCRGQYQCMWDGGTKKCENICPYLSTKQCEALNEIDKTKAICSVSRT